MRLKKIILDDRGKGKKRSYEDMAKESFPSITFSQNDDHFQPLTLTDRKEKSKVSVIQDPKVSDSGASIVVKYADGSTEQITKEFLETLMTDYTIPENAKEIIINNDHSISL